VFKDIKQFNDVNNSNVWLDIVWSLVVLEKANNDQLASVLSTDFVSKLTNYNGKLVLNSNKCN